MIRTTLRFVAAIALIAAVIPAALTISSAPSSEAGALGGPVFISGDDAEDHCEDTDCGGLYVAALGNLVNLSNSPGSGILAIGLDTGDSDTDNIDALESWNDPGNGGPNVAITYVDGPGISSVTFSDFDVIFVPSNEADGSETVGIDDSELALLNARQADLANFVNLSGGGLLVLTEADSDPALAFGFLPAPLQTLNVDYTDVEPTAALAALAPAANGTNLDHDSYHNVFTGPPGFGGLEVLAVPGGLDDNDEPIPPSATILGGAQVVLDDTPGGGDITAVPTDCIAGIPGSRCGEDDGGGGGSQTGGTPAVPSTPVPAVPTSTPLPGSTGGGQQGVIRAPDTGTGPAAGVSGTNGYMAVALLLAVTGIVSLAASFGIARRR